MVRPDGGHTLALIDPRTREVISPSHDTRFDACRRLVHWSSAPSRPPSPHWQGLSSVSR